jgi:hypothetical protein
LKNIKSTDIQKYHNLWGPVNFADMLEIVQASPEEQQPQYLV